MIEFNAHCRPCAFIFILKRTLEEYEGLLGDKIVRLQK